MWLLVERFTILPFVVMGSKALVVGGMNFHGQKKELLQYACFYQVDKDICIADYYYFHYSELACLRTLLTDSPRRDAALEVEISS